MPLDVLKRLEKGAYDNPTFALTGAENDANWTAVETAIANLEAGTALAANSITTAKVGDDQITYAKVQNVSAASRLLGRGSAAGAGDVQEITIGTGLTLTGTTLTAPTAGGNATSIGGIAVDTSGADTNNILKINAAGVFAIADDLTTTPGASNVPIMTQAPFSAVTGDVSGNGSANATAFSTNLGTSSAVVTPGIYRIGVSGTVTISGHLTVMKGAVLKPNSGVTIAFASGATIQAGCYDIFDTSAGGTFSGLSNIVGRFNAGWAPGGDLGAKLNWAISRDAKRIYIPGRRSGWTISTPVIVERDCDFEGDGCLSVADGASGEMIVCATSTGGFKRAVFEMHGNNANRMYNVRFSRLSFWGSDTNTPGCLFWQAAGIQVPDVYDGNSNNLYYHEVGAWGNWGHSILYDTCCEEVGIYNCRFNYYATGDYGATALPYRACITLSPVHGATEMTAASGRGTAQRSHSAFEIIGGTYSIRVPPVTDGCILYAPENINDVTFLPNYIACNGPGHVVLDYINTGVWTGPYTIRGITIGVNGRTEGTASLLYLQGRGTGWDFRRIVIMRGICVASGLVSVVRGAAGDEKGRGWKIGMEFSQDIDDVKVLLRGVTLVDSIIESRAVNTLIHDGAGAVIAKSTLQTNAAWLGTQFDVYYNGTRYNTFVNGGSA